MRVQQTLACAEGLGVQRLGVAFCNSMAVAGATALQGGSKLLHTRGTCRLPRVRPQVLASGTEARFGSLLLVAEPEGLTSSSCHAWPPPFPPAVLSGAKDQSLSLR